MSLNALRKSGLKIVFKDGVFMKSVSSFTNSVIYGNSWEINELPEDVIELIFSRLKRVDMHSLHLTNRALNQWAIKIVQNEHGRVLHFTKLFSDLDSETISGMDLKEIYLEIDKIKHKALNVLKNVSWADLEALDIREFKPKSFDNIYEVYCLYRNVEQKVQATPEQISSRHCIFSIELAQCGYFDKALEVALLIDTQSYPFNEFCISMVKHDFIREFQKAADRLELDNRANALRLISDIYANRSIAVLPD